MASGGTLALVNDLSVKLQKQRKQLNEIVKEVKSASDKELSWANYACVLVVSNILVMATGFVAGMLLYGIGPQAGSFSAGMSRALHSSQPAVAWFLDTSSLRRRANHGDRPDGQQTHGAAGHDGTVLCCGQPGGDPSSHEC